jgi:hypothetical protein
VFVASRFKLHAHIRMMDGKNRPVGDAEQVEAVVPTATQGDRCRLVGRFYGGE